MDCTVQDFDLTSNRHKVQLMDGKTAELDYSEHILYSIEGEDQ